MDTEITVRLLLASEQHAWLNSVNTVANIYPCKCQGSNI